MLAANPPPRMMDSSIYFTLLDSRQSVDTVGYRSVVRDERQAKLNKIELPCVRPSPAEVPPRGLATPAC